jgi:hypothetical protein
VEAEKSAFDVSCFCRLEFKSDFQKPVQRLHAGKFWRPVTYGGAEANYSQEASRPARRVQLLDARVFRTVVSPTGNTAQRMIFWRWVMKMNKLMMIVSVSVLGVSTLANAQSVQAPDANPMPPAANQGPKTREQVRAELAQARMDGTISRFGNPDPYGPGGTPNFIKH